MFRVWAPHAKAVSVVGDFNSWVPGSHPMTKVEEGIWELFIPGIKEYDIYKFCVTSPSDELLFKADPYAFHTETRPSNGSKVYDLTAMPGTTAPGWNSRKSRTSSIRPSASTRCTWAAGR